MASGPTIESTPIQGLLVLRMVVNDDRRGWFRENWQQTKMVAAGLPDFGPVQHNLSYNADRGTTRGLHAEPWDKLVSVAHGRVFGAWADLREGPGFGTSFTITLDERTSVFVPRGVANGFQTLDDDTVYSYLVNDHWHPDARYSLLNLADETAAVAWPIPLSEATVSDKDLGHPRLADVAPVAPRRTMIIGAGGQLGRALAAVMTDADTRTRDQLDLTDATALDAVDWRHYDTVINAAAYTAVDLAETPEGRRDAWRVNVEGTAALVRIAARHRLRLVHVSSDYVFDGERPEHTEDEPFAPLGVYGQTKAAADALVATLPRHYIVRTSWVVGEGKNFVDTMASLADRGISPSVVDDQAGRLTFTDDLAAGIVHLLDSGAAYGTYNLSNSGPPTTWAELARAIFVACGRSAEDVAGVSTEQYSAGKPMAPRPRNSVLDLSKVIATGFDPRPAADALTAYLTSRRG